MSVIAIIGAGPGVGLATARRFGQEGFTVALLSRNEEHLKPLLATLHEEGIEAEAFTADVEEPDTLRTALRRVATALGDIDVLQYSPHPAMEWLRPVTEAAEDDFDAPLTFSLHSPVAAMRQVLPAMRSAGTGTIIIVNGSAAAAPNPNAGPLSAAYAAGTAYARMMHDAVADDGVHVAQLIVRGPIGKESPSHNPADIAEELFSVHQHRAAFSTTVSLDR